MAIAEAYPTSSFICGCDRVMVLAFYMVIYFLPIASAFVEISFGLMFVAYLLKRGAILKKWWQHPPESMIGKKRAMAWLQLFINAYRPVGGFVGKPIAIWTLVVAINVLLSQHLSLSVEAFFCKFLQHIFFLLLAVETLRSAKRLRIFITIFFLSATLIIINGLTQYITGQGFVRQHEMLDGRVISSLRHANDFAAYLIVVLPIAFMLCVGSETLKGLAKDIASPVWKFFQQPIFRIWMGLLSLVGLVCLGLTYSRGAWLALMVAILWAVRRHFKRLLVLGVCMVGFLAFFIPKMLAERTVNTNSADGIWTTSSRLNYWQEAINIVKDYPILGTGLNTYSTVAPAYKISWGGYPHNCYLQMAAEQGLFGLIALLAVFIFFWKGTQRALMYHTDPMRRRLINGLSIGIMAFWLQSFVDTNFYSNQLGSLMWIMMGALVSLCTYRDDDVLVGLRSQN